MAYERGTGPRGERQVERRSVLGRLVRAIFATAIGVLAFIGLLLVAAIVLIVVLV